MNHTPLRFRVLVQTLLYFQLDDSSLHELISVVVVVVVVVVVIVVIVVVFNHL